MIINGMHAMYGRKEEEREKKGSNQMKGTAAMKTRTQRTMTSNIIELVCIRTACLVLFSQAAQRNCMLNTYQHRTCEALSGRSLSTDEKKRSKGEENEKKFFADFLSSSFVSLNQSGGCCFFSL
jgi:hypothetical protein